MTAAVLDNQGVERPPKELVDFAKRQVFNAKFRGRIERRSESRYEMVVPVLVQPVDDDFRAIDSPFRIVTRDISPRGAGLIHFAPIPHNKLALQMCIANTTVNLVARVVWCKPLGPFHGTGVEFIAKLDAFPTRCEITSLRRTRSEPHELSPVSLAMEQCARAQKGFADDCRRS